jgi:phenylacetic acid degradation protein
MTVYALGDLIPVIDPTAFVHPDSCLIGDVQIGPGCYVGPFASLRGDFGRIILEEGSNVQDSCTLHCFPHIDTIVGIDGHVGHGAILHGCKVGRNALIGMNAVIMDNATIGADAFVAAHSFVKAGAVVPERMLVAGSPAREIRALTDQEIAWKIKGTQEYQDLAKACLAGLRVVTPLTAPQPDRPRSTIGKVTTIDKSR